MTSVPDLRGQMFRSKRQMADADAQAFLAKQKIAHIATVDANGWPYVLPQCFIYEGGDVLWFHTGWHQGHFFQNMAQNPRICLTVSQIGSLTPVVEGYACDSSLINTSVVVFGTVEVIEDRERKAWFFDRMLEKYGDPSLEFKAGYPMLDKIILFRQQIEVLTGKQNAGLGH